MEGSIVPIVAKKAEEISKPLGTAIAATLAEGWQGIVGDRVTAWRINNAAKISDRLADEIATRGLTLKTDALPESYAFRWFDKASEEDDPELQSLFAKLLANAASGNEAALERQNIDLISRMTPDAAKLLKMVADSLVDYRKKFARSPVGRIHHDERFEINRVFVDRDFPIALDVLLSLRVLKIKDANEPRRLRDRTPLIPREPNLLLTRLGISLIDALFDGKVDE